MAAERRFRAMGSDAHVLVVGERAELLAERARRRVDELEARWSRFLPDSEISELNRRGGETLGVSWETRHLVERAVDGWRLTGGRVDPTVLGDVLRAGYDRSFDELPAAPRATASPLRRGCEGIGIGPTTVRLPSGSGFDPGGLGKGLAADLVADDLMAAGASGVCVNLGGDLRVVGRAPGGGGWTVALEHPWSVRPLALLGLGGGAVATSTTLRRRWVLDGEPVHHLIDPATGRPSGTDLNQATVVAAEAWIAEVLAKDVVLRGSADPFGSVVAMGAQAVAVDRDGIVYTTGGLEAFLGTDDDEAVTLPSQLERPTARSVS